MCFNLNGRVRCPARIPKRRVRSSSSHWVRPSSSFTPFVNNLGKVAVSALAILHFSIFISSLGKTNNLSFISNRTKTDTFASKLLFTRHRLRELSRTSMIMATNFGIKVISHKWHGLFSTACAGGQQERKHQSSTLTLLARCDRWSVGTFT